MPIMTHELARRLQSELLDRLRRRPRLLELVLEIAPDETVGDFHYQWTHTIRIDGRAVKTAGQGLISRPVVSQVVEALVDPPAFPSLSDLENRAAALERLDVIADYFDQQVVR